MAGRATLVKPSVATIPIYAMQTMMLLQKISQQLDKLSCQFLWEYQPAPMLSYS